jgi:putative redox protein
VIFSNAPDLRGFLFGYFRRHVYIHPMGVKISCEYLGDLRVRATHGPSGTILHTDAPVDNHGKGESFSPTDLTATSLATCIMTILGIQAKGLELDFRGLRVEVEKHMTAQPPRRIAKLEATVYMPAGIAEDLRDRLIRAANACPVKQSLHPDVEIVLTWVW